MLEFTPVNRTPTKGLSCTSLTVPEIEPLKQLIGNNVGASVGQHSGFGFGKTGHCTGPMKDHLRFTQSQKVVGLQYN